MSSIDWAVDNNYDMVRYPTIRVDTFVQSFSPEGEKKKFKEKLCK